MALELVIPGFRKNATEWVVGVVRAVPRTASLYRTAHLRRASGEYASRAGEILEAPTVGALKQDINVPEDRAEELAAAIALLRGVAEAGTVVATVESAIGDEIRVGVDHVPNADGLFAYLQRFTREMPERAGMGGIWVRLALVESLIELSWALAAAARPGTPPQPPASE